MNEYSEDALIEQSAIDVFVKDLNVEHLNCYEEMFPETLGRETKSEVVIVNRLSKAIDELNEDLPEEAKKDAISQLLQDRSRLSLAKANQEIYKLIKDGVKVKIKGKKGYEHKNIKVINFSEPEKNDFFLASQFWVTGDVYTRRPDLVLFVNGLPLVIIELKARGVDVKRAFEDNISDYKDTIPQLFWYNAFIVISNGRDTKIGSITSGYEHFSEWKRISKEKEVGKISLDTLLKGMCEKNRFIDILENFIIFTTFKGNQIKIIAKNHQYLGVNNAIESFKNRKKNKGRLGVFWHTQGAGKSYSMIFFTQKILRKIEGNFTFLIVTDRLELDDQIYENFQNAGVVTEEHVQATSGPNLKRLLKEDHRLVFTIIHKFGTKKGEKYPKLSDRDDIIVITDEAHRTQYDTLALNMRNALPNASFIGFTGTPLMSSGEEKTKDTFGDYVSIYNFGSSIDDHATVPLYYENRVPELEIINPELNDDIYDAVEEADLNEEQEEKLSREFSREYHVITRDDRLNVIAEDIVKHFVNRGYEGKAMVISIDKLTVVKMYDKVQYYWKKYIEKLEEELKKNPKESGKIKAKIDEMKKTDMAVVISQEQNEIKKFKKEGLDITKHRKRMVTEKLDEKFKDPENNLKIVFVCSMWMTGFDVQCLSTIYLDKPMKNHTLMQAIARANRVFEDKPAGFIVDYISVFKSLKKALSIYATPVSGQIEFPIQSKDKLVELLKGYVDELDKFLKQQKVDSREILVSTGLSKNELLGKAVSSLVTTDDVKNNFLSRARRANKIYRALLPHKDATEFTADIALYQELMREIYSLDPEVDITEVMKDIEMVLDKSIVSKGYVIEEAVKNKKVDLSKINFEALKSRFEKKKSNADIEQLKNVISMKLKDMIKLNNMRSDYQEKFQRLVDEYNLGSKNAEWFFNELVKFSNNLNEEDRRKVVEGLTEEELALFDKLRKKELSEKDKNQVKNVAKELLEKLKEDGLKAVDWRKKQQTRALVRKEIEVELDEELPKSYSPDDYKNKCDIVFQHFFDNYYGEGQSVFSGI
jgi:type I restriction enzyme R subunit